MTEPTEPPSDGLVVPDFEPGAAPPADAAAGAGGAEGTMAAMEKEIDQTFHLVIGGKKVSKEAFLGIMAGIMVLIIFLTFSASAAGASVGPAPPDVTVPSPGYAQSSAAAGPDCPHGYLSFGESCYFFSHHKATWTDAQASCQQYGGTLATIQTQEEDDFIANHLTTELVANDDYWIGLNDVGTGQAVGPFAWDSGDAYTEGVSYNHWLSGEPNNAANGLGRGDCVRICPAGGSWGYATAGGCPGGMWGDFLCDSEQHYVCEMAPARALTLPAPPQCPPEFITSPTNGNCYFFSYDVANYADAENACTGLGGVLACIQDQMEDEFIRDHLVTRVTGNMDYWIGYHDRGAESEFAWSGGCRSTYENWFVDEASGTIEPNNAGIIGANNDCVRMCPAESNGNHDLADGTRVVCTPGAWADFSCDVEHGYVCEVTPYSVNPAPPEVPLEPPCPKGYRLFGTNCYLFSSSKATYADAESACSTLGGTLASIQNSAENEFITSHLTAVIGGNDDFWIGFHDRGSEGNFEWSGGLTSRYTNWQQCTAEQQCTSEPNGAGGNGESVGDCVRMCPAGGSAGKYGECIPGMWADYMCEAEFHYICEIPDMTPPPPRTSCPAGYESYRGKCYYFAHYPASWDEAQGNCSFLGGDLATVASQEEDDFIANHLTTELTGNLDYWIGLNDVGTGQAVGPFAWDSGDAYTEGVSYNHWLSGEPNNAANGLGRGDCVRICPAGESWGYATAGGCPGGMWGDFLCDYKLPYVCEMAPFPRPRAPPAPAPCPAGYIASGENCYFFSYDVANYADAENACETLGGVLACIKDQMEDEFIRDHLVTRISGNMDYWIGYHDRGAEAEFAWSGGCRSTYENWFVDVASGTIEPNNQDADGTEGDCVRMCPATTNGNHNLDDGTAVVCTPGAWADFGCEQPNAYVCEVPRAGAEPAPHRPSEAPPCPIGFLKYPHADPLNPNGATCYLFSLTRATWSDASLYCQFIGGRLADIADADEDAFLQAHQVHIVNTLDNYWIGVHQQFDGSFVWEGVPAGTAHYEVSLPWLKATRDNMLQKNHYVCEVQY